MAIDWSTRPSSSMATHSVVRSAPPPPYSSGNGMPNRPELAHRPARCRPGSVWSRSQASAWGAISLSAKSRTTLRNASCSSVSSRLMGGVGLMGEDGRRVVRIELRPSAWPRRRLRRWPWSAAGWRTGLRRRHRPTSAALDSHGFWAVVLPFDGRAGVRPLRRRAAGPPWPGPAVGRAAGRRVDAAASTGPRSSRASSRSAPRSRAGDVYQVNLTRRLPRCPLPTPGADVAALGAALAAGNPAPFSAVVRLPDHGVAGGLGVARAVPARATATGSGRRRSRARPPRPTTSSPRTGPRT